MPQPLTPSTRPPGPDRNPPRAVTDRLKAERIQEMLRLLPAWRLRQDGAAIERSWTLPGLRAAAAFGTAVAAVVEDKQHEALITVGAKQVSVVLTTPQVQGLSEKDIAVAVALELGG